MTDMPRISVGLWVLGKTGDRFCLSGYRPHVPLEEQVRLAGLLAGVSGVECHSSDFDDFDLERFQALTEEQGLVTTTVNTNVWSHPRYALGAFTHRDPGIRRQALDEGKRSCEVARRLGCPAIGLWLGSDGYDYPFQVDYAIHWDLLVDGLRQVAEEAAPDIQVSIEYKLKEPRVHLANSTVGTCLALIGELGMENVGGTVDFGHALMAQENPAESVVLLQRQGKLFNVHFNDAWGHWDDDMVVGTVNLVATLEFLYCCRQARYQGWLGLDMFPYREDGAGAAQMAVDNLSALWEKLDRLDLAALAAAQETMGALETQRVVRRVLLG